MSFAPALPLTGHAGWRVLQATLARQQAAFAESPAIARETADFRARIGGVQGAAELVADRALLKVALGAFGLGDDLPNRHFVQKVLQGGTQDPQALANRLADARYRRMAAAFGFGDPGPPRTAAPGFADRIADAYETRAFEAAVGARNDGFRLALNARRELPELAQAPGGAATKWFRVMGTPPLRAVFEGAYGLPQGFGALDIDRQRAILADRTEAAFGARTVELFADPDAVEGLIRRYLAGQQAAAVPATAPAVRLLTGAASAASAVLAALYP